MSTTDPGKQLVLFKKAGLVGMMGTSREWCSDNSEWPGGRKNKVCGWEEYCHRCYDFLPGVQVRAAKDTDVFGFRVALTPRGFIESGLFP